MPELSIILALKTPVVAFDIGFVTDEIVTVPTVLTVELTLMSTVLLDVL